MCPGQRNGRARGIAFTSTSTKGGKKNKNKKEGFHYYDRSTGEDSDEFQQKRTDAERGMKHRGDTREGDGVGNVAPRPDDVHAPSIHPAAASGHLFRQAGSHSLSLSLSPISLFFPLFCSVVFLPFPANNTPVFLLSASTSPLALVSVLAQSPASLTHSLSFSNVVDYIFIIAQRIKDSRLRGCSIHVSLKKDVRTYGTEQYVHRI